METKRTINVLIVDDQAGVRYLLDVLIKDLGHNTFNASNGLEAIEWVKKVKPELIFMDVRMPIMDGLEALGRIKTMSPSTEVVMMTANYTEEVITKAQQKGAAKCMAKPFDVEQIRDVISEYLWDAEVKRIQMFSNYA
jgi:two-component system response regulator (stage 0 sporulation protein F)